MAITILSALGVSWFVLLDILSYPDVLLDELILLEPDIPYPNQYRYTDINTSASKEWHLAAKSLSSKEVAGFNSGRPFQTISGDGIWIKLTPVLNHPNNNAIVMAVYKFDNAILSAFNWRWRDPLMQNTSKRDTPHNVAYGNPPGFSGNGTPWNYVSKYANVDMAYCFGDLRNCSTWCYWARYGQYLVLVILANVSSINDSIQVDAPTFQSVVEHFDRHVGERLLRAEREEYANAPFWRKPLLTALGKHPTAATADARH